MRGKGKNLSVYHTMRRITPARAGKRWTRSPVSTSSRDHPRACGEKNIVRKASFDPQGSPPRVRGKVSSSVLVPVSMRITPARAGKSYHSRNVLVIVRDHPRACGEKTAVTINQLRQAGSPPRVRGKDCRSFYKPPFQRITPARAGKSALRGLRCAV